jgi:hypothetical protein
MERPVHSNDHLSSRPGQYKISAQQRKYQDIARMNGLQDHCPARLADSTVRSMHRKFSAMQGSLHCKVGGQYCKINAPQIQCNAGIIALQDQYTAYIP